MDISLWLLPYMPNVDSPARGMTVLKDSLSWI